MNNTRTNLQILTMIAKYLCIRGLKCKVANDCRIQTDCGICLLEYVGIESIFNTYQKPTGKKYIWTASQRLHTKSWPQRKDGSYNYNGISRAIINRINFEEATRLNNIKTKQLCERLGFYNELFDNIDLSASANINKPVCFNFIIKADVTEEKAEEIYNVLNNAGLLKLENEG